MDGKKLEYKGDEALKELEKLTMKADEVQESILKEILARNGKTEYLNKYMGGSKDVLEFKSCVPVIMYNRIRPYIQRIANGEDSSLITGHPITEMLCRSLSLSSTTSSGIVSKTECWIVYSGKIDWYIMKFKRKIKKKLCGLITG